MSNHLGHNSVKKNIIQIILCVAFVNIADVASADSISPVTDMVMRGATGLALCLAAFGIAVFVMKRTSSQLQGTKREIIIKERISISGKTSAVLVEVRGVTYLMVAGSEHVSITSIQSSGAQNPRLASEVLPSERLLRVGGG